MDYEWSEGERLNLLQNLTERNSPDISNLTAAVSSLTFAVTAMSEKMDRLIDALPRSRSNGH